MSKRKTTSTDREQSSPKKSTVILLVLALFGPYTAVFQQTGANKDAVIDKKDATIEQKDAIIELLEQKNRELATHLEQLQRDAVTKPVKKDCEATTFAPVSAEDVQR